MNSFPIKPQAVVRTGDNSPASSLFAYIWRMSGTHQVWICLLAVGVAVLSMIPLELQRRVIDDAVADRNVDLLVQLGIAYLCVLLIQGGAKFVLRMYQGWLSESAVRYNREHLSKIHDNRPEVSAEQSEGQVVSVIGAEVDKLGGFVGEGLSQPVVNVVMLLATVGFMMTVEPQVAVVSLAFLLPQVIAVPYVQRYINKLVEKRVSLLRDLGDALVELPKDDSSLEQGGIIGQLDATYANHMQMFLFKFGLKVLINLLNALAPLSVLVVGGYLVIEGETTIGVVVAFTSGFDRLANPLRELIGYYRMAAHAMVQHRMIADWIVENTSQSDASQP